METQQQDVLSVKDLEVELDTEKGKLHALKGVSFEMRAKETLAIVGESGCGKSMTALSVMGLLPKPIASISQGSITLAGHTLTQASKSELQAMRGKQMSMIFQEPMTSLNPVMLCGKQILEAITAHDKTISKKAAAARALEMIKLVGIPAPEKVYRSYPHELSGGMRQRIMIAMALATDPHLLICDEPTTALDVTVQAQILQLIDRMKTKLGTAVMLITHDMGVVSEMADWVLVMYAGHTVEYTKVDELFTRPLHPYTQGLIASIPKLDDASDELYAIEGNVPMLSDMPKGCPFHPRCPFAREICKHRLPQMEHVSRAASRAAAPAAAEASDAAVTGTSASANADGNADAGAQSTPATSAAASTEHKVACWKYTSAWEEE